MNFTRHFSNNRLSTCISYSILVLLVLSNTSWSKDIEFDDHGTDVSDIKTLLEKGVANSLKFIVMHYKTAVITENELDILLDYHNFEDKEDRMKKQWEARTLTFQRFANRAQTLITKARQGKLSRTEVKDEILAIHKEKEKHNNAFDSLESNSTRYVEVQALEKQKEKIHDQINKFTNMADEFTKHMLIIHTLTDLELNHKEITAFNGEFVEFDIQVLEHLLELYQTLEELKLKLDKLEDNAEERAVLTEKVSTLEQDISENVEENKNMIGRHMPSTTGILVRSMEKLFKVDQLYKRLSQQMDDSNKELRNHMKQIQTYNDIMDEAASVWFSLKNEL